MQPSYAELHCISNFSFLRGASHPEELVERALALGYTGLAITDECSFAGAVRAHLALRALSPGPSPTGAGEGRNGTSSPPSLSPGPFSGLRP
jgi:error-prone DNA polymerase